MDKASLRKHYLERRINISRSDYWRLTDEIMAQVKQISWKGISTVHIFMPIRRYNEIDTFSIISYLSDDYPDIQLVIPRANFKDLEMENVLYDHSLTILHRNKYDIPEPVHGKIIDPHQIDLVFVPLLICDMKGNRVGYGKGFYDRFLKQCREDTLKIGLSFFDPVDEISDILESDQPIDACITPGKIRTFSKNPLPLAGKIY